MSCHGDMGWCLYEKATRYSKVPGTFISCDITLCNWNSIPNWRSEAGHRQPEAEAGRGSSFDLPRQFARPCARFSCGVAFAQCGDSRETCTTCVTPLRHPARTNRLLQHAVCRLCGASREQTNEQQWGLRGTGGSKHSNNNGS